MKPALREREAVSSGVMSEGIFGISLDDQAHILNILRDRLYTNKILAVLREYGSNAWDSHIEAGKADVPIKVVLPTALNPTLIIRDYGLGIPEEDIFDIYIKYGASTKRTSNSVVGTLGIGCKSGFAYSDTFSVTSFNGGMKRVYVAFLDETNIGKMSKVYEEPSEETGIEIQLPVHLKDLQQFQSEAKYLYSFFEPHPDINLPLIDTISDRFKNGFLRRPDNFLPKWVGVMGCVAYKLDFFQLRSSLNLQEGYNLPERATGGLRFEIGEVDVAANREELEYTDFTIEAIRRRLTALHEEVGKGAKDVIDKAPTGWEKYAAARDFAATTGVPIPPSHSKYMVKAVELYPFGVINPVPGTVPENFSTFKLIRDRGSRGKTVPGLLSTAAIPTNEAVILVRDEKKSLGGYNVLARWCGCWNSEPTYIIVEAKGAAEVKRGRPIPIDAAVKELDAFIQKAELDGIPVKRLSSFDWEAPSRNCNSYNIKHHLTSFTWHADYHGSTDSSFWTQAAPPGEKDIFVLLDRFCIVQDGADPQIDYQHLRELKVLLQDAKEEMPPIYGLKTTLKNRLKYEDVKAIRLHTWFPQKLKELVETSQEVQKAFQEYDWYKKRHHYCMYGADYPLVEIEKELGPYHPLLHFLFLLKNVKKRADDAYHSVEKLLPFLTLSPQITPASHLMDELEKKYPLLCRDRIRELLKPDEVKHWLRYVQLVDKEEKCPQSLP